MPRLSLYQPIKGNNYKFIDKTINEMFQVGGTDVLVHKYLGTESAASWDTATLYKINSFVSINEVVYKCIQTNTSVQPPSVDYWEYVRKGTPSTPVYKTTDLMNIQDLLFLENRDRSYAADVYVLRGVYNIQDIDFNLSQFGLFLQNDTIFVSFHINDTVEKIGRRLVSGDVIELPHLIDEHATNDLSYALKRFYVIDDVNRASEGFSATWYPHLYRAKCKPLVDSQEFKDILNNVAETDNYQGNWNSNTIYFPNDVITSANGKDYVAINPQGMPWTASTVYYPGDIVNLPSGETYQVVDITVPSWGENELYAPGDRVTGPDGTIYRVTSQVSGILPPNTTFYTSEKGTGVITEFPETSDRYQLISVAESGMTNISPPNFTFWALADTLSDIMSTYNREMQITKSIMDQADYDTPRSGRDTTKLFTLSKDATGQLSIASVDSSLLDASIEQQATDAGGSLLFNADGSPIFTQPSASTIFNTVESSGYDNYLYSGDGIPANGAPFTAGIAFTLTPTVGEFCLRQDFFPHRLFRFSGTRWIKVEDNVRMTLNNLGKTDVDSDGIFAGKEIRRTQKTGFINNANQATINNKIVKEKQSLSTALRPQADN